MPRPDAGAGTFALHGIIDPDPDRYHRSSITPALWPRMAVIHYNQDYSVGARSPVAIDRCLPSRQQLRKFQQTLALETMINLK